MQQGALFNFKPMTTTKQSRALKKDRQVLKTSVPAASRFPSKDKLWPVPCITPEEELELHLPDESRTYDLKHLKRCPVCDGNWTVWTATTEKFVLNDFHGPILDRSLDDRGKPQFHIRCANLVCNHKTPMYRSATDAVACWEALAKLMAL
jgi:hypothetical protein